MFLIGGIIAIYLIVQKLSIQSHGLAARPVTDQPLFFLALTMAIVGVQMFLAGFLGELIGRRTSDRNSYLVDDKIDVDNIKISE